jgi:hypothetical protein
MRYGIQNHEFAWVESEWALPIPKRFRPFRARNILSKIREKPPHTIPPSPERAKYVSPNGAKYNSIYGIHESKTCIRIGRIGMGVTHS